MKSSSHPPRKHDHNPNSSRSPHPRNHHIRIKSLPSLLTLLLLLSLPINTLARDVATSSPSVEGMERANKREIAGVGAGVRARAGKSRLRERAEVPEVLDLGKMVKTVSTMRNGANQLLTETCYFSPKSPSMQYCVTTVDAPPTTGGNDNGLGMAAVAQGEGDGATETFWPAGVSTIDEAAASAPTSVLYLPSALFPSGAVTTQVSGTITASISEQNSSPTGLIYASNTASSSSSSPTPAPPSSSSTPVLAASAASTGTASKEGDIEAQAPMLEFDTGEIPGQHLTVLPIGLSIYCAMVGLILLLTLFMLLVRIRYRQKYRQRRHNPGMAIAGIAGMAGFAGGRGGEMGEAGLGGGGYGMMAGGRGV